MPDQKIRVWSEEPELNGPNADPKKVREALRYGLNNYGKLTPENQAWYNANKDQKPTSARDEVFKAVVDKVVDKLKKRTIINHQIFDLLSTQASGKWTLSEFQKFGDGNNHEKIPRVILTEYKVNSSSTVQSARVSLAALRDISTQGGKLIPDKVSDWLGDTGAASVTTSISKSLDGLIDNSNKLFGQENHPDLTGENHLGGGRYVNLFSVTETGYTYILPYFSETYFNIGNNWSDSAKTSSKLEGKTKALSDAGISMMNAPGFWDPGVYIERPKFYNFDFGNEVEVSVNFPLINTHKFEDVSRNIQLIKNLVIQNLPYRKTISTSEIPVIYDVKIPGVAHHPFCFIKKLDIKHAGNKRITTEFDGTPMLIPDAYMVSITLVSMVLNASNFYLEAFGDNINGIQVTTHLSPAAAETPEAKEKAAAKAAAKATAEAAAKAAAAPAAAPAAPGSPGTSDIPFSVR